MSLKPVDCAKRRILAVIYEFVYLTNDLIHDLVMPEFSLNWTCKQTAALRNRGLLESGELADDRLWFRTTPKAQRLIGVPIRPHRDKGPSRRLADLAIVDYCLGHSPRLRRLRLNQQRQLLSDVPSQMLKRPICHDPAGEVLEPIFVRCDLEAASIARDCWKYVNRIMAYDSVQSLIKHRRMRLVIITATRSYAKEIRDALDRGPSWPLARRVVSCPRLMELKLLTAEK
jgi:hypothetical protein